MATGYVRGNESPEIEKLKEQAWALYNKTKNWSDPAILALHEKAEQLRALQGYSGGSDGSKRIPLTTKGYVKGDESPEIEKLKEAAWALYNKTKNWSDPAILALHEKAEQLRALQGYSGGPDGSKRIPLGTPTQTPTQTDSQPTPTQTYSQPIQERQTIYDIIPEPTPYTPQYSTQDIINLITQNANLQYEAQANTLRNRVADIIAKYTGQLGQVDSQYQQMYQQNELSKYQTNERLKEILARAGLLGSGIEIGNIKQNEMNYNMARQNIDLQKQMTKDELMNQITGLERDLEYNLNQLANQRDAMINQAIIDEMHRADDVARDEYWRQYEANLRRAQLGLEQEQSREQLDWQKESFQQQLDWHKESFQLRLDYDYEALNKEYEKFMKQYNLELSKFEFEQKKWTEQLAEQARQFDETLGWDKESFAIQMRYRNAELAQAWRIALMNNETKREEIRARLQIEREEFASEFEIALRELGLKEKQTWIDENNSLDAKIFKALEEGRDDEFIIALIDTSRLPFTAKEAKKRMIINSITGQSDNVSTSTQRRRRIFTPSNQIGNWGFQSGALSEYPK